MKLTRTWVAIPLIASLLGCGGSDTDSSAPARSDEDRAISLQIDRPDEGGGSGAGAAVPDGGTAGGHGADVTLKTNTSRAVVTGTVEPAGSAVEAVAGTESYAGDVADAGRFRVELTSLRRGESRVRVEASSGGERVVRVVRVVRLP